jgi:hypothetical protein
MTGATIRGACDFSTMQSIKADQNAQTIAKVESLSDFKNDLKAIAENTMKSQDSMVSGMLSTAFGNNQDSNIDVTTIIRNEIEQNVTNENMTECNAILDNANKGVLILKGATIDCTEGTANFGRAQDIISSQVASCYSDALTTALMQNSQIAEAVTKTEAETKMENKGVGEAIASAFTPFTDLVGKISGDTTMVVIIIIVAIAGIGIFLVPKILESDAFKAVVASETGVDIPMGQQPQGQQPQPMDMGMYNQQMMASPMYAPQAAMYAPQPGQPSMYAPMY